jgi:hypothetical protein
LNTVFGRQSGAIIIYETSLLHNKRVLASEIVVEYSCSHAIKKKHEHPNSNSGTILIVKQQIAEKIHFERPHLLASTTTTCPTVSGSRTGSTNSDPLYQSQHPRSFPPSRQDHKANPLTKKKE